MIPRGGWTYRGCGGGPKEAWQHMLVQGPHGPAPLATRRKGPLRPHRSRVSEVATGHQYKATTSKGRIMMTWV
jgi:hypothetical protein